VLISLSGQPGVGKTTIARELAAQIGAVHLRIDSIEQTLRNQGIQVEGEGYPSPTPSLRTTCAWAGLSSPIA